MANELKFNNKVVFKDGVPVTLPSLASDPGSAVAGDFYYNSTDHVVKVYDGSAWNSVGAASITDLTGDVTATGPGSAAATVVSVGGSSASNINLAEIAANAATGSNSPSTIVKRDGSGNFSAGIITAGLVGDVTGHASEDLALAGGTMTGAIDMGSNLINNVTDPASAQDAATKNYVDTAVAAIPSGANTALSNLASTAVNVGIAPGTSNSIDLGSATKAWNHVYSGNFQGLPAVSAGAGQSVNLIGTSADSAGSQPGGDVNITAGDAFHFATTAGNVNITAGASHGNSPNGGVVTISGGAGNSPSIAGKVIIQGGASNVSSTPGTVEIYGGANPNDGGGGAVLIQGGPNTGSVGGGNVTINGGPTTTGPGGSVTIQGGTGTTHGTLHVQNFTATNFHSLILSSVADPVSAQDVATKNYVDTAAGSGANTTLSNLGTTAINADLIFNTGAGANLKTQDSTTSQNLKLSSGVSTTGNSGAVIIASGNSTGGGDSGNINIQIGTTSGGNPGQLIIQDGTQGNVGDYWTSTDASGRGHWVTPPAQGANTALSNLVGPTAINADLLPASNDTVSLGASGNEWLQLFVGNAVAATVISSSIDSPFQGLGSGADAISLTTSAAGDITLASKNLTLDGGSNGGILSIANYGGIDFNTQFVSNIADPSSPQDAATKNYVDTAIGAIVPPDLSQYLRADGTTAMTADLNAGGFNFINLADPTSSGQAVSLNYLTNQLGAASGIATLDGGGKVPAAQLPSTLMNYQGAWDASSNTPTLADGTGANGDVWRASVAGTQDLGSGPLTFAVGDFAIYNGTIWEHSPAADGVSSVNGNTGAVTVNAINQLTGDVTAGPASGSASAAATIAAGAVTNSKIAAAAGISLDKLAALTASIIPTSDASGFLQSSSSIPATLVASALNRGLNTTNVVSEKYVHATTLTDNSGPTAVAAFQFAIATAAGEEISYVIETGDTALNTRIGTIRVTVSNGGSPVVSMSDMFSESADCGITWTAGISGGNVTVSYTATNQGANRTMRADVKTFLR